MARPLRIWPAGGRFRILNRDHRRSDLFLEDADQRRFRGLRAEWPERLGIEIHAFVLRDTLNTRPWRRAVALALDWPRLNRASSAGVTPYSWAAYSGVSG